MKLYFTSEKLTNNLGLNAYIATIVSIDGLPF